MNMLSNAPVETVALWCEALVAVALLLALFRVLRGPTLADRIIALDVIGTLLVGVISLQVVRAGTPEILPAAMVAALINFVGVVGVSFYIYHGER